MNIWNEKEGIEESYLLLLNLLGKVWILRNRFLIKRVVHLLHHLFMLSSLFIKILKLFFFEFLSYFFRVDLNVGVCGAIFLGWKDLSQFGLGWLGSHDSSMVTGSLGLTMLVLRRCVTMWCIINFRQRNLILI